MQRRHATQKNSRQLINTAKTFYNTRPSPVSVCKYQTSVNLTNEAAIYMRIVMLYHELF